MCQEGALLVTFRKKLVEIDLLVQEGDTVALGIKSYRPFVDDPELRAVRKPDVDGFPLMELPPAESLPTESVPTEPAPAEPKPAPPVSADSSTTRL